MLIHHLLAVSLTLTITFATSNDIYPYSDCSIKRANHFCMAIDKNGATTEEAGSGCFLAKNCKVTVHLEVRKSLIIYTITLKPPEKGFSASFFVSTSEVNVDPILDEIWPIHVPYIDLDLIDKSPKSSCTVKTVFDNHTKNCSVFRPGYEWPGPWHSYTFTSDINLMMTDPFSFTANMVNDTLFAYIGYKDLINPLPSMMGKTSKATRLFGVKATTDIPTTATTPVGTTKADTVNSTSPFLIVILTFLVTLFLVALIAGVVWCACLRCGQKATRLHSSSTDSNAAVSSSSRAETIFKLGDDATLPSYTTTPFVATTAPTK